MFYPNVHFYYDVSKDIENIKIGLDTVRKGREPDRELRDIIKKIGNNPDDSELESYVKKRLLGKEDIINVSIKQTQEWWNKITNSYFDYLLNRMQLKSFDGIEEIDGYFSIRYGSGYSVTNNWFAVSIHNSAVLNGSVAMHEIMHILFHKNWWQFCVSKKISDKSIWDIKEAITVLLNLWFDKLMINSDLGYKEHTELRRLIKNNFLETRDFKKTLSVACDFVKSNRKSPSWV
jgi:hypothetical protein